MDRNRLKLDEKLLTLDKAMASLSRCHLQIDALDVKLSLDRYLVR